MGQSPRSLLSEEERKRQRLAEAAESSRIRKATRSNLDPVEIPSSSPPAHHAAAPGAPVPGSPGTGRVAGTGGRSPRAAEEAMQPDDRKKARMQEASEAARVRKATRHRLEPMAAGAAVGEEKGG